MQKMMLGKTDIDGYPFCAGCWTELDRCGIATSPSYATEQTPDRLIIDKRHIASTRIAARTVEKAKQLGQTIFSRFAVSHTYRLLAWICRTLGAERQSVILNRCFNCDRSANVGKDIG